MPEIKTYRVGEINKTNHGIMKIIEYNNKSDIVVEFQDEHKYRKRTLYHYFKIGRVTNPYYPHNNNIGYIGNTTTKENNKKKKSYLTWNSMLVRCYSERYQTKHPSYIGCIVCEEWHSYENFEKWYIDNYYECENERTELDKDILVKGNKLYSPNTCMFVPKTINTLLLKSDVKRNGIIGTHFNQNNKYTSQCKTDSKTNKNLGTYDTELEAFLAYKEKKEEYIKTVANRYKEILPLNVYKALLEYKIEITD